MKISFCVTYYNQSRFVAQSLDSILALDVPCSFEILVGDDGSSDDTVAKVKEYQTRFPDRMHLFVMPRENGKEYNPIHRASANRLHLAEHATGDFIMFLDGDDHYCATDFIPKALSAFERDKGLVACAFGYQLEHFGKIRQPWLPHKSFSVEEYVKGIYIHSGAFVFRNVFTKDRIELLKKSENFDDNVISLYALQFGNVAYVDESIYGCRQNESSIWNSASQLERDLLNAEDCFILSSVAPKFRTWILKRQFGAIKQIWNSRQSLQTALGEEKFVRHLSDVRRRNDRFLENCLDWNNLLFPQRLATYAAWLKMRLLVVPKPTAVIRRLLPKSCPPPPQTIIDFGALEARYAKRISSLRDKATPRRRIRAAFLVMYDSVFPAEVIYRKLLDDDLFDPVLVLIPDVSRGKENMLRQMRKAQEMLSSRYGHVEVAYDSEKEIFVDWPKKFDICFFSCPYEAMTNDLSGARHLADEGVLSVYVSYGMMPDYYSIRHIIDLPSLNLAWRVFADTEENLNDFRSFTKNKGQNVVLSGYAKLDLMAQVEVRPRARKKIIVAPHHTVSNQELPLSNFLRYADFFLDLPKRYPDVDFVFRPHPLLFVTLANDELWGKGRVERYLAAMRANTNVEYQDGGDYFDTFVNSDGIIHDCSSFLVEYLFTEHPPCYLLRDNAEVEAVFTDLGKNCLKHCYQAFCEKDVIRYVEKVVLQGGDPMHGERVDYVNRHLKVNYPHASDFIIQNIKEALT